jgi:Ca-activated chloride channel family protein
MEFHLLRPQWLLTLVPALVLLALLWRQRTRSGSWQAVIAPQLLRHLLSGTTAVRASNLLPLVMLGWLLAALAASGPSWQKIPQPVQQKQDALVILLDLSYSMKSADLQPSRLERARQKLLDLLQQRREGQTGLIAYAGDAHIVTPLTDDTPTIANLLPALSPDMMPLPGSEPVSAVTQALELLRSAGIRSGRILLVTDGVSKKDRDGIERVLRGSNVQLSVMGVGTASGAPIPLPEGGFLKDEKGAIVMPGLDEQGLRQLADATGGSYRRMQLDDSDLQPLLQPPLLSDAMNGTQETWVAGRSADTWEDQGYLLVLALLPLALGLFRRGWLLTLLPLLLLAQPHTARANTWDDLWLTRDQQGQRALQQGDNGKAATLFKNPGWAGTAAYQNGDYETAVDRFNQPENADSQYNRGNALAHAGKLDEAIASYEKSLELKPGQADAQANLDTVRKLKEQQQQQKQQQQNQKDDKDKQQDKDQKQDQDQKQGQNQQQGKDQQQGQEQKQAQNQQQGQDQQQSQDQKQDQKQDQNQQQDQKRQQDQGQAQNQQHDQSQQQAQGQDQDQQQAQAAKQQPDKQEEETAPDKQQAQAQPATPRNPVNEKPDKEQAAAQPAHSATSEQDQAMEQWLRRVPDDPSGLLRQKFRYESRVRQLQGARRDDESYW